MCLFWAAPALADHVVVKRDVTFHEGPAKSTAAIAYPKPGDEFQLLDDGARVAGYYHVAGTDGRDGWLYFTFVERRAETSRSASHLSGQRRPRPWRCTISTSTRAPPPCSSLPAER